MTKILGVPKRFGTKWLDNSEGIDVQTFQLWFPAVRLKLVEVAGDGIADLNYGQGGVLVPRPFNVKCTVEGTTADQMASRFDGFFGIPPTGYYGTSQLFYFGLHSDTLLYNIPCYLSDVDVNFDAAWWNHEKKLIVNVTAQFTPTDEIATS